VPDPAFAGQRFFAPREALRELVVLGVIGSAVKRKRPAKTEPESTDQLGLFSSAAIGAPTNPTAVRCFHQTHYSFTKPLLGHSERGEESAFSYSEINSSARRGCEVPESQSRDDDQHRARDEKEHA